MVTQKSLIFDGPAARGEQPVFGKQRADCVRSKFYGQAERAISNGKLNALLRLHIRPIKQVVYLCPT